MTFAFVAVACVVLLVLIAVTSAAEVSLTHLTIARATAVADDHDKGNGSGRLVDLVERRESLLPAVLVTRVAGQASTAALVAVETSRHEPSVPVWVLVGVGVVAVVSCVEVPAKALALARTSAVAARLAPLMVGLGRVPLLRPLGTALARSFGRNGNGDAEETAHRVSEEELLAMAEVAADAEVIERSERALIESIIAFGDTIVREVMVPRPDMVTVEATWALRDVMEVIIANGYSRVPVVGDGIDDVVGVAYAKDLMRAEREGRGTDATVEHARTVRFVPEQQRVAMLLPEMQAEQFHMAIVIDEYGGVAGLVTLEDLIEELVGEIVDEFDVEVPLAESLPGGSYRINARMPLDQVNELLTADLPAGDWDTLGGLLFGTLGHVPEQGESVDIGGHRLTATRVQGRRIGVVRVDRLTADEADEPAQRPSPTPDPEKVER